jgi:hypothetical protein
MPEREPMNPELAAALRAYEIEVRDGTERSQKNAFEQLRRIRQRLGKAALSAPDSPNSSEPGEQQLAAS